MCLENIIKWQVKIKMSKYRLEELINIDNRFQKSVNLLLDLQNEEKVNSYIPTRSSVNILKQYLKSITSNAGNKANILIGPYGKGKSHLLLVLMSIIAKKNKAAIDCITSKIKDVDDEAYTIIENYIKNEKPMLPVIISTAGEDLNKAFLFALNEALEDSGLSAISPKSYYSEAYKTIMVWKGNYPDTYRMFEEKVCRRGIKLSEFIKRLNSFDDRVLNIFREIYPSLTAGSEFNPLISSDMLKIYKETNTVLCEKYGYNGIYIIFDEFSKFIEGHRKATFASDMNIIQNICELANNSKTEKVRITFVAHKSIKEYGNKLDKDIVDSFKGVEGRLSEVLFVVSSQNSYELIKDAIEKKKGKEIDKILAKNSFDNNMDRSYAIPCFSEIFERQDFMEVVAKGCFPLTPIASYLLLNISEKVAQNERTVFTFLSSNEPNTLCRRMAMCDENGELFVGADAIFDYFKILFKEEVTAVHIHNEWLKADYALSKTNDEVEQKIIKALALIRMNAKDDELSANVENIALSIGISKEQCEDAIKRLEEKQVIVYRAKVRSYTFRNNVGVNLEKEIQEMVTKIKLSSISDAIREVSELDYILPKQYNQQYSMTRYCKYEYMMFDEFMAIKNSNMLFEEGFADGKIIAIINNKEPEYDKIIEKTRELKDKRLIVICPDNIFDKVEQLAKYIAVKKLLEDKSFIDNNKVLMQELMLYEDDLMYEINERINMDYKLYSSEQKVIYMGKVQEKCTSFKELNRFVSKICNNYYNYAPKINNELINKQNITAQIAKARNKIIDDILDNVGLEKYKTGTSAEATIYRAAFINTGICGNKMQDRDTGVEKVMDIIQRFVESSSGTKRTFKELYDTLMGEGFGVRKGVIPMYFASVIVKLEDMPVVYLGNKELNIDSKILVNINEKPEEYSLFVEKENAEKMLYIKRLHKLFVGSEEQLENDKRKRLANIADAAQRWYRSLPQYATTYNVNTESSIEMIKTLRNIFKKIEINPREVFFDILPGMYDGEDRYGNCYIDIEQAKNEMDNFIIGIKNSVVKETKKTFGIKEKDNLKNGMEAWYEMQSNAAKEYVHNSNVSSFMNLLTKIHTHDELAIADKIAKAVIDLYIEDWNDNTFEEYKKQILDIKNTIEDVKDADVKTGMNKIVFTDSEGKNVEKYYEADDSDSTSYFLKNAIEEAMDEFGDTLETNQKVTVLVKTIEKLLNK